MIQNPKIQNLQHSVIYLDTTDFPLISSCRASVNANQIVVRAAAEAATEQPETERRRNWTAVSDKTKEQQGKRLIVLQ